MPSIKAGNANDGADSDDNMSVIDGGDSSSRAADSSAEDEPDSDDSEMDENEVERRRSDCLDNLANLEKQFAILRDQLYQEKVNHVEMQMSDLHGGRSQEYLLPLQQLDENMQVRTEVAGILKQFRLENIQHKFESEEQAAKQHYESECGLTVDYIRDELLEKIRRLEEDRHNYDISWSEWNTTGQRINKVRGPGRKKAVTVTGPYIVYMLHDHDIMEDWTAIRKALKRSPAAAAT